MGTYTLFLLGGSSKDGQIDRYLKNHYIFSNKIAINKAKNTDKNKLVTNRKSVGYKAVKEKVLNWTSKGR